MAYVAHHVGRVLRLSVLHEVRHLHRSVARKADVKRCRIVRFEVVEHHFNGQLLSVQRLVIECSARCVAYV